MRAPSTFLFIPPSLAALALVACSQAASSQATAATPPPPFVLQFVGTYASATSSIVLNRDGTYVASLDGKDERGSYTSATTPPWKLPLSLTFTSEGDSFAGSIDSYGAPELRITSDGRTFESFDPKSTVGPDESLCDRSHGTWRDDDPDETGSLCVCPQGQVYIPSLGGCVS